MSQPKTRLAGCSNIYIKEGSWVPVVHIGKDLPLKIVLHVAYIIKLLGKQALMVYKKIFSDYNLFREQQRTHVLLKKVQIYIYTYI